MQKNVFKKDANILIIKAGQYVYRFLNELLIVRKKIIKNSCFWEFLGF